MMGLTAHELVLPLEVPHINVMSVFFLLYYLKLTIARIDYQQSKGSVARGCLAIWSANSVYRQNQLYFCNAVGGIGRRKLYDAIRCRRDQLDGVEFLAD